MSTEREEINHPSQTSQVREEGEEEKVSPNVGGEDTLASQTHAHL